MNARTSKARCVDAQRARAIAWLVLAFALVVTPARAQQPLQPAFDPANEFLLQNFSAEFPPIGPDYSSMRPGLLADHTARLLRDSPAAPETFEMLVYMERAEEAASVLRRIIQQHPEQMARPFELLWSRNVLSGRGVPGENPLPQLIADARSQLGALARPEAARVERALIFLETRVAGTSASPARPAALRAFIERYAGTAAAREAEVDLITSGLSDRAAWINPLDDIARRYPGTTAAAKALSEKAFQLSTNLNRRRSDPTDAFLQVFAIVKDLESGRYPPSDWVARAPWLAIELTARDPVFGAGNADRLRAAYVEFVREHFTVPESGRMAEGVASVVTYQIFNLFELRGEGMSGVERTLDELERIDALRAQYVRGAFYAARLANEPPATRPALLQKARSILLTLARSQNGLYARRALATLASLDYRERDFTAARTEFASYLAAHPDTAWSWVAAIRIAQCDYLLGDPDRAITEFRAAATRYAPVSIARTLGHAFAGYVSESTSSFAAAADDYERALQDWGNPRRTVRMESYRVADAPGDWPFVTVQGVALRERVTQIRQSVPLPGGALLERGRYLLAADREGAIAAFEELARAYPTSPLTPEARRLSHTAKLRMAIDQVAPGSTLADRAAGLEALTALAQEPWDDVIGIAKMVRATVVARQGFVEQASTVMTGALREWQQHQATTGPSSLPPDVVRDVAAIRRQVFEGEDPAAPWRGRFGFRSESNPAFPVVNPHITVSLASGVPTRELVYPDTRVTNLLFMTSEQMGLLVDAMNVLAGAQRPTPPPDQRDFLSTHLPLEVGMLGGVTSFASVPNVQSVHFTNEERTRAEVGIRTFSSGGTLLMEKQQGSWRVIGVADTYVN